MSLVAVVLLVEALDGEEVTSVDVWSDNGSLRVLDVEVHSDPAAVFTPKTLARHTPS